jgi:outer membrane immunogenic protein
MRRWREFKCLERNGVSFQPGNVSSGRNIAAQSPFASRQRALGPLENEETTMKKFAIMAAVAAAALFAVPAVASAQWYAGAGYTQYEFDDAEVGGVTGRLGYNFNQNFGVEGEGTFGVDDDDGVELDNALGAYAVGRIPLSGNFGVHGRLGYQNIELDTPLGGVEDDGVSYGVGASWQATPGLGVRADYTRFEGDDDADAITLGGQINF